MRVVGFIGPSGTGKSYRALWVAKERNIDYIIDDGLLIYQSRIIAGKSAKKAPTQIGSIKTALFYEEQHREQVAEAIRDRKPQALLILGTSDGMVEKIAKNLELGKVSEKIYISDVATEFEIEQAIKTRSAQGKHVIPVPSLELKKDFSGFFWIRSRFLNEKPKGTSNIWARSPSFVPLSAITGNTRYPIMLYIRW